MAFTYIDLFHTYNIICIFSHFINIEIEINIIFSYFINTENKAGPKQLPNPKWLNQEEIVIPRT